MVSQEIPSRDIVAQTSPTDADGGRTRFGRGTLVAIFVGTHENKVDRKGRVSVPAKFRDAVSGQSFHGVVIYPHYELPALEGCGMDQMETYVAQMDSYDLFSSEHEDLATILFADSEQLAFDGEGRIMLPEAFRSHAGIGERAVFAGKGRKFQIWAPEAFARERDSARQRAREKGLTLPLRNGPAGNGAATGGARP